MTHSYEIGTLFAATGTATINGTVNVVGSGTLATTELVVGYLVNIAGETRVVSEITDNTHWKVTAAFAGSSSGNSISGVNLKNLANLASPVKPPKSTFDPFGGDYDELGDGSARGLGAPVAVWRWAWLTRTTTPQAQRDSLRTFCASPAISASVYIRTRKNDSADAYAYFSCVMNWPHGAEDKDAGRRSDFELRFTAMTELSVS